MKTKGANLAIGLLILILTLTACEAINSDIESANESSSIDQQITSAHISQTAGLNQALAEVRSATSEYNDVDKAENDGYTQFSIHIPFMGIHYLNNSAINPDGSSNLDGNLNRLEPEILVYVDDASQNPQRRLVAVEYAIPMNSDSPPQEALNLFPGLEAHDWHVHPSSHELPMLNDNWTIHGECHYQGGLGVFLAEDPNGNFVLFTPPTGAFGSWSGTIEPAQCPSTLGGNPLPPLLIVHGKWWTLHAWVWQPNPEGVFHPTNPRIGSGN